MKSRILICITAMTLFAALAIPNRRAAQGAPTYTVLYAFTGGADGGSGGSTVVPGVVLDNKGNLYGTTVGGGDLSGCFGSGCGVVFKVDPTGSRSRNHGCL